MNVNFAVKFEKTTDGVAIGVDGLTVLWNIEQLPRLAGGTVTHQKTGEETNLFVGRNGLYGFCLEGAEPTLYDYIATAYTDGDVDAQELSGFQTLWSEGWYEILLAHFNPSVATSGGYILAQLANLDVPVSSVIPVAGAGAKEFIYTVQLETGVPIGQCLVWVTSDVAGNVVLASGITNDTGDVVFYLNPGLNYFWRKKAGYNFVNPDIEVVTP